MYCNEKVKLDQLVLGSSRLCLHSCLPVMEARYIASAPSDD
jgi:hypothetical protein